jgi:hypothetical protein
MVAATAGTWRRLAIEAEHRVRLARGFPAADASGVDRRILVGKVMGLG